MSTIPNGHVRVHVRSIAVSHSNNNTRIGDLDTPPSTVVVGHGSVGSITGIGPSVTTLQGGDNVAIELASPCFSQCHFCCTAQDYTRCTTNTVPIPEPNSATSYILPFRACTSLGPLTLDKGALVEPIAIAFNLVHEARLSNKRVIIFGANFIGVFCYVLARSHAAEIMVVDTDHARLPLATGFGATTFNMSHSGTPEQNAGEIVEKFSDVDVVINASGDDAFISTAIHVLGNSGLYLQAGVKPSEDSPDVSELFNGITFKGNIGYVAGDFSRAVSFIGSDQVDMDQFLP